MSDLPFDRRNIGVRERPASDDINSLQSEQDRSLRYALMNLFRARTSNTVPLGRPRNSFAGDSMLVYPSGPASMTVHVRSGMGMHYLPADVPANIGDPDLAGVDDFNAWKPMVLMNDQAFAVPAAPGGGQSRIDLIEAKATRQLIDATALRQLNPATGNFDPKNFYKTLTWALDGLTGFVNDPAASVAAISYKVGTPGAPGATPGATPGYITLARILVGTGVVAIDSDAIIDDRQLIGPNGLIRCSARYRVQWNGGAPIVTYQSVLAPPGVFPVIYADTGRRSQHTLRWIGAGAVTQASINASCGNITAGSFIVPAVIVPAQGIVGLVDAGEQTDMQAATAYPPTKVAVGQSRAGAVILANYQSGATTSFTNVALEDVVFHTVADIAYH